jgi:hypothetical protein
LKKRQLTLLICISLLFSFIFIPVAYAADDTELTPFESTFLGAINYDNAERMAIDITEGIGNRYTASFRRDMTVDYIMNEFQEAGYEPYIHEFINTNPNNGVVSYYVNGSVEFGGNKFMLYGPAYNADTVYKFARESKRITGAVILPWAGGSTDLTVPDDADYGGKVVFLTIGAAVAGNTQASAARYYSAAKALQDANAGAVIFEWFQPREDGNTSYSRIANTTSGANAPIYIPVGAVLYNETHPYLQYLNAESEVEITMDTSALGKNVVAVLPSATGSKKTVYITSHLDSQVSTPGMNDNASGVIMTIELARAFRASKVPFEYNIAFICFDAEETGLRGARAFCADMTDEDRENFVANYNVDMIATNQENCIHMFLNISDTDLRTYETPLSNDQRLILVPEAVEIAQKYDIFNHSYLAALKTGFDMDYFNICYDTTTDHYAFVAEAAKFPDGRFDNMRNAVEYDWRTNEKGTAFETLYHKTGDTFDVNYSRERNKKISDIVALATYYSAKAIEPVEEHFFTDNAADCDISITKKTDGSSAVRITIPLAASAEPAQIDWLTPVISGKISIPADDISYEFVTENGVRRLAINFDVTASDDDILDSVIDGIEFGSDDDTIIHFQNFTGGLKYSEMNDTSPSDDDTPGGDTSQPEKSGNGGGCDAGFGAIAAMLAAAVLRRRTLR